MMQPRAVTRILGATTAGLIIVALFSSSAAAQQRDTTRAFVRGGIYDKPFLTRLGGRTTIGGYAEAHARWERVDGLRDEAGFEAKRFNIFTNTRVSDFVRIGAELEFEEGGEEIKVEYAAIDFLIHPSLAVRGGMLLSPLGRFNLSHDSPLNEFTDRPLVAVDLLGVALSEPGFGVLGQVGFARTARVTYELYATNGFHDGLITDSEDGTRIPFGRGNFEDNNGSPALVGRVAVSPRVGYELGASAHHGAYNVFNEDGTIVDERRDVTIATIDAEAHIAALQLSGEAATVSIDVPPGLTRIYAERQRGVYVDAVLPFGLGWISTMPDATFALKARYDYVDFDTQQAGQSVRQASFGVNFRPTPDSVLKLDYVRGGRRDEFNNLAQHAFLLVSLATYF